jgi:hypothetical protein
MEFQVVCKAISLALKLFENKRNTAQVQIMWF